jgi:Fic family protein
MRAFLQNDELNRLATPEIVAMLGAIHEYKGKQEFYLGAKPDTLEALLEMAKIQSTDASNRIEGIYTSDARFRKLVGQKTTPRNRNEREILGYRDVLATIHESHDAIPLTPSVILQLHRDLYHHLQPGIGGVWKATDNVIAQTDADGNRSVRFAPAPAFETPMAMESLCAALRRTEEERRFDPLLVSALFVLDFLCIHPFSDGNGRMSRLLTLLLLYKAGYAVGKYISLEAMIERSKEAYYDALQASSENWHEGKNDPMPFLDFFLQIVLGGYREFESRIEKVLDNPASKATRIRTLFDERPGRIRKKDVLRLCPDISEAMVEKTLKSLLSTGYIRKLGAGPATSYAKN